MDAADAVIMLKVFRELHRRGAVVAVTSNASFGSGVVHCKMGSIVRGFWEVSIEVHYFCG